MPTCTLIAPSPACRAELPGRCAFTPLPIPLFTHPGLVLLTSNQVSKGKLLPFRPRPRRRGALHPFPGVLNLLAPPIAWSVNASTPPPLDPSSLANSSSLLPCPTLLHLHVYTQSPIPQVHALPYIPPAPLTPGMHLHPALITPNLQYDVRLLPTQSNPHLSPVILSTPATIPPLPHFGTSCG